METTEQNKTEEKFRKVLELAPDGIVVIDHDRKMRMVNVQTEKMFGYTRQEMIGKEVEILMPNRFRHAHPAQERKFIAEQKPRPMGVGKELFGKRKDGIEFPIEISLVPLQSGDEKEDMTVLAVIRDITKQKIITKELTEAKAKAEIALQYEQQFLANMSHEIRTPMTSIIGFTQVLLKTDLSERQKEYLQIIKRSGDALIVLINDILDLAKVDAGKMTFEQIPFKMEFSISNMLRLFDLKIQEKNLELVEEYDNKIPEVLVGDAIRLHQIILNLLSNALKFTSTGKITVAVRLLDEDKEKATIRFTITDTGIGISENQLASIFDNFQQATSSISRIYGGTGLGLAICKQLVEKQGGTIGVKSKINEGSAFSFILSFLKTSTEVKLEDAAVVAGSTVNDIKILVVEDVKLNQLLMSVILDDFKFKHDIADNGKIAVEKMRTDTYDIILMDLHMPEMDGFEAAAYIRKELHSNIPIIALTADVTTVAVDKCKALGINDYISKPIDERILYSKIVSLLN